MNQTPQIYTREQHNLSRADLDNDALKIMYRLIRHGYKAYLVGGGVRDLLLNKKPKDFDISTDATPKQIKSLFGNCRIIGRRFKLAHVFFQGGKIIEVSTFRDVTDPIDPQDAAEMEQAIPQRQSDNRYGTAETDAIRRDLTINGLFYDPSTFSVIDYVGGVPDLKSGIVRMIGDPEIRIAEDPVRIIRAIRHAARAGFEIEEALRRAIHNNASLLQDCPSMRVFEEIKKDLCSGYCFEILGSLSQHGVLQQLWPELDQLSAELRSRKCTLGRMLNRIDAMILAGRSVSSTAVLSLIALFIAAPQPMATLAHAELDREQLREASAKCFSRLAVPRRERMKIDEGLVWWAKLTHPDYKIKSVSLGRSEVLAELLLLADVFELTEMQAERYQLLKDAAQHPSQSAARRGRRPARRRPDRRRARSGHGRQPRL